MLTPLSSGNGKQHTKIEAHHWLELDEKRDC